ncbi:MAG: AEC family transporter [Clostridiales bacterium]|nr:AEC family transporter [Clostridiales bacterium]
MLRGLESVGIIFLIFAVGYFLHYKKQWPDSTPSVLSNIVTRVSAPCLAVTSIVAGYTRETLAASIVLILIAFLHMLLMLLIGKGSARMLGLSGGRKAVFEVSFTFSNVIFIGLPVNQIVFGEAGLPPLFAYYIIGLACFWSFGVYMLASAAPDAPGLPDKPGLPDAPGLPDKPGLPNKPDAPGLPDVADAPVARHTGKRPAVTAARILNPGFIGVLIGYFLVQAGLGLPPILDIALGYLASVTIPLSLLVIGANLTMFAKGIPRVTKDEVFIMAAKFVVSPLVMLALLKVFGVTGLPFYVFLLSSTMPCHMQSSIIAQHYNVEPSYASKLVGLSTLLSIVTIPCYAFLIHSLMA